MRVFQAIEELGKREPGLFGQVGSLRLPPLAALAAFALRAHQHRMTLGTAEGLELLEACSDGMGYGHFVGCRPLRTAIVE